MLDESKIEWFEASADEKRAAEVLARSYLITELEQNLIPSSEAKEIVKARIEQFDETWARAVFGMLKGIRQMGVSSGARDSVRATDALPSKSATLHDGFLKDSHARAER